MSRCQACDFTKRPEDTASSHRSPQARGSPGPREPPGEAAVEGPARCPRRTAPGLRGQPAVRTLTEGGAGAQQRIVPDARQHQRGLTEAVCARVDCTRPIRSQTWPFGAGPTYERWRPLSTIPEAASAQDDGGRPLQPSSLFVSSVSGAAAPPARLHVAASLDPCCRGSVRSSSMVLQADCSSPYL